MRYAPSSSGVMYAKQAVQNVAGRCSCSAWCTACRTSVGDERVASRGPQRVPGEPGERSSLDALAAHVADRDRPTIVGDGEHVVEVAADQVCRTRRPVAGRNRDAVGRVEVLRQQAELQRLGDVALLVVETLVVGRELAAPCRGGRAVAR